MDRQKADVYSFAIVMWEILTLMEPFESEIVSGGFENEDLIIQSIRNRLSPPLRPLLTSSTLTIEGVYCTASSGALKAEAVKPHLCALIRECWQEDANQRPAFTAVGKRLTRPFNGAHGSSHALSTLPTI